MLLFIYTLFIYYIIIFLPFYIIVIVGGGGGQSCIASHCAGTRTAVTFPTFREPIYPRVVKIPRHLYSAWFYLLILFTMKKKSRSSVFGFFNVEDREVDAEDNSPQGGMAAKKKKLSWLQGEFDQLTNRLMDFIVPRAVEDGGNRWNLLM